MPVNPESAGVDTSQLEMTVEPESAVTDADTSQPVMPVNPESASISGGTVLLFTNILYLLLDLIYVFLLVKL